MEEKINRIEELAKEGYIKNFVNEKVNDMYNITKESSLNKLFDDAIHIMEENMLIEKEKDDIIREINKNTKDERKKIINDYLKIDKKINEIELKEGDVEIICEKLEEIQRVKKERNQMRNEDTRYDEYVKDDVKWNEAMEKYGKEYDEYIKDHNKMLEKMNDELNKTCDIVLLDGEYNKDIEKMKNEYNYFK